MLLLICVKRCQSRPPQVELRSKRPPTMTCGRSVVSGKIIPRGSWATHEYKRSITRRQKQQTVQQQSVARPRMTWSMWQEQGKRRAASVREDELHSGHCVYKVQQRARTWTHRFGTDSTTVKRKTFSACTTPPYPDPIHSS